MPIAFSTASDVPSGTDVLGIAVFAGPTVAADAGAEVDVSFLTRQGFEGKVGETLPLLADDGGTVIAVGLGDVATIELDDLRRAAAAFAKAAWQATSAAFVLPAGVALDARKATKAVVEGVGLSAYQGGLYKSAPKPSQLRSLTVVGGDDTGAERGAAVVEAVVFARDLVNEPAGAMSPSRLADAARAVADKSGFEVTVLDEKAIEREALGGLLGVSRGSAEPPRLIRMEWSPPNPTATVVLVGKGITFDSGGLSLKSGEGMMHMKGDMAGAAAVLATMTALPTWQPSVRVIGIIPATENMPGGRAIKPGDVLRFRNGKTAEVLNTDAEGRLVLADGLSLAVEAEPDAIIDLATLTGACVSALGREIAGVMGNDDGIVGQVIDASQEAGEPMWHLPLPKRYRKHIDSDIADMKNVGVNGQAGALSAGLFLQEFVADVPWAHLDIAGPSWSDGVDAYTPKGGTGVGVRTLLELLDHFEPVR
jgi:leucyl aminopeptidase